MRNTAEQATEACAALQLLMESGADIHAVDSSGNSALGRAVLDARQILPTHRYNDPDCLVRVPEATLRYWRHLGTGPHGFRIGRSVRYWRNEVVHWLSEQSRHPQVGD